MSVPSTPLSFFLAAVCFNPVEDVASDQVDLIEINHFHDEQGRHVFDQIIFYDWSARKGRYLVQAWRQLKDPAQMPRKNWGRGDFVALWRDEGVLREVRATTFRESWTQYDPEVVDRRFLPKTQRRELRKLIIPSVAAQ